MAEQHHELAHVFAEASQGVLTMHEAARLAPSIHPTLFPAIPKRNGPKKLQHYVSRFALPTA